MTIMKYLIITKTGNVTLRQQEPRLSANEIALRIHLQVPDALFKRPILEARMEIPDEAVPHATITPQIRDNVENLIKEATGLNMVVSLVEQETE